MMLILIYTYPLILLSFVDISRTPFVSLVIFYSKKNALRGVHLVCGITTLRDSQRSFSLAKLEPIDTFRV